MEKAEKFGILVLDDDICIATGLTRALRSALPDAQVLAARNVAEAQLLLAEYKLQFFVLDIHLPDGTGIDFLCDIQTANPAARCIIMTAAPLPDYREQAESLGVLRFFEKPVDVKLICALAVEHRDALFALPDDRESRQFAATLSSLTPMDIIQLKCLGSATAAIEFVASQGSGRIFFSKGQIIHAETKTSKGEAAFQEILGWRGGRVVEVPSAPEPPRTILTHWQSLLLNAAQAIDESRSSTDQEFKGFSNDLKP